MARINVTSCTECPFFVQTLLSLAAAAFGECGCPKESGIRFFPLGEVGPEADRIRKERSTRLRVLDATKMPAECPLRAGDVVVGVKRPN